VAAQQAALKGDAMLKDHKVGLRTRGEIKLIAERARRLGGDAGQAGFKITNYLRMLAAEPLLKGGQLKIRHFAANPGEAPAFVTYNPTTLHVDREIWEDGDQGEPGARFILAHELGHVILHDHHAQPFSGEKKKWIPLAEESAEWQANTFADYFLISDEEADAYITPVDAAIFCAVEREVALRRLAPISYVGEYCQCGGARIRRGIVEKCECCGSARCN
jgi:IrrE N-terminal-like domain